MAWGERQAWSVLSRWDELEPVEHRRPVPKAVVELGLEQSGLRHPHYLSRLCQTWRSLESPRSFLVLPEDLGAEPGSPCLLKVSKPKPGRRGMGRVQLETFCCSSADYC